MRSVAKQAFTPDDKAARRATILNAADVLFSQSQGGLPTVSQIAEKAYLGKGTVYIYFKTKEGIFATLLLEKWEQVFYLIQNIVETNQLESRQFIQLVNQEYVSHLSQHVELLRLDAVSNGILEQGMKPEEYAEYKAAFNLLISATAQKLEDSLQLEAGHGHKILLRMHALTRGLWQSFSQSATQPNPDKTDDFSEFSTELSEALTEYLRGALLFK